MISSLSSQIKKCRSLKDCTAVIRGLEANAPRSDRIFADDAPMPNTYCPMTVLTKKQLFLKLCWSTDTCGLRGKERQYNMCAAGPKQTSVAPNDHFDVWISTKHFGHPYLCKYVAQTIAPQPICRKYIQYIPASAWNWC